MKALTYAIQFITLVLSIAHLTYFNASIAEPMQAITNAPEATSTTPQPNVDSKTKSTTKNTVTDKNTTPVDRVTKIKTKEHKPSTQTNTKPDTPVLIKRDSSDSRKHAPSVPKNKVNRIGVQNKNIIKTNDKRSSNVRAPTSSGSPVPQSDTINNKSRYAIPVINLNDKSNNKTSEDTKVKTKPTIKKPPTVTRKGFIPLALSTTTEINAHELSGTGMRLLLADPAPVTPTVPPEFPDATVINAIELKGTGMRLLLADPSPVTPTAPSEFPGATVINATELKGTGMRLLLADPALVTPTAPPEFPGATVINVTELKGTGVRLLIQQQPKKLVIHNQFSP